MINFMELKAGQHIVLKNNIVAEVLDNIGDGIWVQVRYLESPNDPSLVGSEELCHCEEAVRIVDPA
ncbi:hypothetical protein D8I24_2495 (plasmid) [Cupriavidus necator H850]|nr:hypothetical protein D8I24_2495 [Cupriavidus necator H850]